MLKQHQLQQIFCPHEQIYKNTVSDTIMKSKFNICSWKHIWDTEQYMYVGLMLIYLSDASLTNCTIRVYRRFPMKVLFSLEHLLSSTDWPWCDNDTDVDICVCVVSTLKRRQLHVSLSVSSVKEISIFC